MTRNAIVIRERGVIMDGEHHLKGAMLRLPLNQFDDLEGVGIVREATEVEVNRESEDREADKPTRKPGVAQAKPAGQTQRYLRPPTE